MQVKVSLGTFTDVGEAIKKLFEFKFTHAIKGIRSELLAEAADEVMRKHMGIFDEKKAVILEAAEKTVDELRASNEWAIIASLPPHEIPLSGDYRHFDESTGKTTIVNERFIAAYHRALEKLWSGEAKTTNLVSEQPQPEQQQEEKIVTPEDKADAVFASWKQ